MTRTLTISREAASKRDDYLSPAARRLLDSFFGTQRPQFCAAERVWNPPTDIFETRDSIVIKMELAGVHEDEVEVQVSGNYLVIRGRRVDDRDPQPENYHLMEIHYGQFERIFRLPSGMELHDVSAILTNGFLRVTIPKGAFGQEICIEIE